MFFKFVHCSMSRLLSITIFLEGFSLRLDTNGVTKLNERILRVSESLEGGTKRSGFDAARTTPKTHHITGLEKIQLHLLKTIL